MFDSVADIAIKLSNYTNRSRLHNIYYSPVTSDRFIIIEKILDALADQATVSIELLSYYIDTIAMQVSFFKFSKCGLSEVISATNITTALATTTIVLVFFISIYSAKLTLILPTALLYSVIIIPIVDNRELITDINNIFEYTNWLVEETFRLRNVYIDSNFFLTNDATKGIERFTDLIVP